MKGKMPLRAFRIPSNRYERFRQMSLEERKSMNQILNDLMERAIKAHEETKRPLYPQNTDVIPVKSENEVNE